MIQGLFFRTWADLIQEYFALQLKYESDRLPALAGIADLASCTVPSRYISGIWEANLPAGLLWLPTKYPAKPSSITCVPSWSWASVIGPIKTGGHNPESSSVKLDSTDIHET
ncbi:hypothetical protein QBC36DRAFT_350865 [Triangularia setosa]|uniref:Uncharacterized protein n=1 Tax=Triangularia setosa TaxID=2587417 RepID=A0AAN7A274_9PEZI|nr:hypothetical protein QBC36DRAFT_350865 [Podospora setosa]